MVLAGPTGTGQAVDMRLKMIDQLTSEAYEEHTLWEFDQPETFQRITTAGEEETSTDVIVKYAVMVQSDTNFFLFPAEESGRVVPGIIIGNHKAATVTEFLQKLHIELW